MKAGNLKNIILAAFLTAECGAAVAVDGYVEIPSDVVGNMQPTPPYIYEGARASYERGDSGTVNFEWGMAGGDCPEGSIWRSRLMGDEAMCSYTYRPPNAGGVLCPMKRDAGPVFAFATEQPTGSRKIKGEGCVVKTDGNGNLLGGKLKFKNGEWLWGTVAPVVGTTWAGGKCTIDNQMMAYTGAVGEARANGKPGKETELGSVSEIVHGLCQN